MTDFTIDTYRQLLIALKQNGYLFFTFQDYCLGNAKGRYVILRHDIDKKPDNALSIAKLESDLGVKSTFYFLTVKDVFKPDIIKEIEKLGHEIGYHYRDLVDAKGNYEKAILSFENNLFRLRSIVNVSTVAMDGCPWSKFDNLDIWKKYDYKKYGIIGEPYFDIDFNTIHYMTDTGRMWDGGKYSIRDRVETHALSNNTTNENSAVKYINTTKSYHTTEEIICSLQTNSFPLQTMITSHPQRWTNSKFEWIKELIFQRVKNVIKRMIKLMF